MNVPGEMELKRLFLREWEEVVGRLNEIKVYLEVVFFRISLMDDEIEVEVPIDKLLGIFDDLYDLNGKMLSILRTDKAFLIRGDYDNNGYKLHQKNNAINKTP